MFAICVSCLPSAFRRMTLASWRRAASPAHPPCPAAATSARPRSAAAPRAARPLGLSSAMRAMLCSPSVRPATKVLASTPRPRMLTTQSVSGCDRLRWRALPSRREKKIDIHIGRSSLARNDARQRGRGTLCHRYAAVTPAHRNRTSAADHWPKALETRPAAPLSTNLRCRLPCPRRVCPRSVRSTMPKKSPADKKTGARILQRQVPRFRKAPTIDQ